VYVEYNDEPSLKMVKEIGLDSLKDIPQSYRQKKTLLKKDLLSRTDKYGRDLLSRMLIGSRVSISIGVVAVLISLIVGIFWCDRRVFWRKVDAVIMWLVILFGPYPHCFSLLLLHWH
jgi:peptide/nickel transport system permease protein